MSMIHACFYEVFTEANRSALVKKHEIIFLSPNLEAR